MLGRFTSADSIVPNPGNPLDWDRFSYVRNNPLRYVDPSGHAADCGTSRSSCGSGNRSQPIPPPANSDSSSEKLIDLDQDQPDWGMDQSESWRVERSLLVMRWLAGNGGFWGSGFPDARSLILFLANEEGLVFLLDKSICIEGDCGRAAQAMVGYMQYLYDVSDGPTASDLSRMTAFFNPEYGDNGAWNQRDRDAFLNNPPPLVVNGVDMYWGCGPVHDTTTGAMITRWWYDSENLNYTTSFSVDLTFTVNGKPTTQTLRFGFP